MFDFLLCAAFFLPRTSGVTLIDFRLDDTLEDIIDGRRVVTVGRRNAVEARRETTDGRCDLRDGTSVNWNAGMRESSSSIVSSEVMDFDSVGVNLDTVDEEVLSCRMRYSFALNSFMHVSR